jgi:hypothetical protein
MRERLDCSTCTAAPRPLRRTLWERLTRRTPAEHIRGVELSCVDGDVDRFVYVDIGAEPETGDYVVVHDDGENVECPYHAAVPIPADVTMLGVSLALVTMRR